MKVIRHFSALMLCLLSLTAFAATPDPTAFLKNMTDQLLSTLKQNRARLKSQPTYVYKVVDKILLPNVDTVVMSQSVLGRRGWMQATPAQRREFTGEFTTTVIRTYASALNNYTDEKVQYFPIRGGYQGRKILLVNSKIIRPDGPAVPITYSLILRNNQWKIFDLNVEGVSLLQSFRSQFSSQLSQGKTVAQIIQNLKRHNGKLAAKKS